MGLRDRFARWVAGRSAMFDSAPQPIDQVLFAMHNVSGNHVSRADALSVPAIVRGRNLLCSVATLPLVQLNSDNVKIDNPLFRQLDPDVPNVVTLAQTIEDLVFDSIAWWEVTARDFAGFPTSIRHLDPTRVSLRPPTRPNAPSPLPSGQEPRDAAVYIDGVKVDNDRVIRFDSPNPALLSCGRPIRRAILLDRTAAVYADNPRPLDYFSPSDGADPVSDDEVRTILAQWQSQRKEHGTAYVPASLKYNSVDSPSPADLQLVELVKQTFLELANLLGVDPEDLGVSTTSRTYSNNVDRRRDRINDVLSPYMRAVTDRLSMGDVTRRGHRVQFVLDDYLKSNPTERATVQKLYFDMGVLDVEEIRDEEGLTARPPAAAPGPVSRETAPPADASTASARPSMTFADDTRITFGAQVTGFTVDRETRTITGMLMPYNAYGTKMGMRFRFAKGALKWSDPSRVKLLRDHDGTRPIGYAKTLKDTPAGLTAVFKVGRGPAGDEALSLAEDRILDGLSAGTEFDFGTDVVADPRDASAWLVTNAALREGSLTALPAFDDARLTSVNASLTDGRNGTMPEDSEATAEASEAPATGLTLTQDQAVLLLSRPGAMDALAKAAKPTAKPVDGLTFTSSQIDALIKTGALGTLFGLPSAHEVEGPTRVDPTRRTASVSEPDPYRFDRKGNLGRGSHDFSSDLIAAFKDSDKSAYDRALSFVRAQFDVVTTNVAGVNPNTQRPDLYVDQRDFRYPVWESINKGTLTDITPFVFPKFSSAGSLVGAHTQGTEPSSGTFVVTTQTVTPTAMSGKAKISREVFDAGGNPQVSDLIWRQMQRGWFEALEAAAVAELDAATPTSLGTFTIGGGTNKQTLVSELESALAALQFVRGGFSMTDLFAQVDLYLALVSAKDTALRPYYASVGPANARGTTESRFGALDVNGVVAYPAWALAATGSVAASSYLFDRASVHGWASAPNRLDIDKTEVANVYLGIWGYKATAISDINGVREVIYDPA